MTTNIRSIKLISSDDIHRDCNEWINECTTRFDKVSRVFRVGSAAEITVRFYDTVKNYHDSPIGTSAKKIIKSETLPPWFLGNTNAEGVHIVSRAACDLTVDREHMNETMTHEYVHACTHKEFPYTMQKVMDKWYIESIAIYLSGRMSKRAARKDAPSYLELSKGMKYYYYGYYIGLFIENEYGVDGLINLLANECSVSRAFGISDDAFNSGWHALLPNVV